MEEKDLPKCCDRGEWLIRDSQKRLKELNRRGFSSLPRTAVCSICGRVISLSPGLPSDEFIQRKKNRKLKSKNYLDDEK